MKITPNRFGRYFSKRVADAPIARSLSFAVMMCLFCMFAAPANDCCGRTSFTNAATSYGHSYQEVEAWPVTFGGKEHCGWLPPHAATPKATPIEKELLDVRIEQCDGGYLLIWEARTSATC